MFRMIEQHLYWWPVTVRLPDPDAPGTIREQTFQARFELLDDDSAAALDAAHAALPPEAQARERDYLLKRVIAGWREVVYADGAPIPFSGPNLDRLLGWTPVRAALYEAYAASLSGDRARLGN